jgi:hypothetical protein
MSFFSANIFTFILFLASIVFIMVFDVKWPKIEPKVIKLLKRVNIENSKAPEACFLLSMIILTLICSSILIAIPNLFY